MEKLSLKPQWLLPLFGILCLYVFAGCVKEKEPNEISVSIQALQFERNANFAGITLTANTEWEARSSRPWCRPGTSKGRFSQQVQILVDENDTGADRTAIVTFKTSTAKQMYASVIVSQSGGPAEEFSN